MTAVPSSDAASAKGAQRPKLTILTKTLYGAGTFGLSAKNWLINSFLLLFYNQIVGLDAGLASLAIAISLVIDAIWNPLVGYVSDNTTSRWGRRHPFIYAGAIPSAIAFALVFFPPRDLSQMWLFAYFVFFVSLARILESTQDIPHNALMPELTTDYHERTVMEGFRLFFGGIVGAVTAAALGLGFFLAATEEQPFGQLNYEGYGPLATTIAALGALFMILAGLATHRFIPHLRRPSRPPNFPTAVRELKAIVTNRNYLALLAFGFFAGSASGVLQGLAYYFYTFFWELDSSRLLLLPVVTIPAGIVGVLLAPFLVRRMGKRPAAAFTLLSCVFLSALPIIGRLIGIMPPNDSPWLLPILLADTALAGCLAIMVVVIHGSMIADVVEEVEVQTGKRSEGVLFATENLLARIASGIGTLIPGLFLMLVDFPANARPGEVDWDTLRDLALLYVPAVLVLFAITALTLLMYKIDEKQHLENLRRISNVEPSATS